jgi:hypothetical protein
MRPRIRKGVPVNKDKHVARGGALSVNRITLTAVAAGVALAALVILLAGFSRAEAATLLKGSFRGDAYATFANAEAGPVATQLGRSAYQPCPCVGTRGKTLSNTVDGVEAGEDGRVLKADATLSTVRTTRGANKATVRNASEVTGLDAFDGLITADAVRAVANVSANRSAINSSPNGSTFVNLVINGTAIPADVDPNTRVKLPGIGYVLLKSVERSGNKNVGRINVDMITVVVTRNNDFGLPIGSRIVVAHALAGFVRSEPAVVVGGQAYVSTATATTDDVKNRFGKAAFITMGCEGTNGKTRSNNVNLLDVGDLLSADTGKTTAFGGPTKSGTVAKTTANVENLFFLDDLIRADAITVVAQDRFANGKRTSSTNGTKFANLVVAGVPVAVNPPPNTRLKLPGIGYVVVNEQKIPDPRSTDKLQVNGLHVFVTRENRLGLPAGTEVIVAHAESSAVKFRR